MDAMVVLCKELAITWNLIMSFRQISTLIQVSTELAFMKVKVTMDLMFIALSTIILLPMTQLPWRMLFKTVSFPFPFRLTSNASRHTQQAFLTTLSVESALTTPPTLLALVIPVVKTTGS